jgi:gamma-glutamyl-gamma-aminobutyrate hydrolase PuuD
MSIKNAHNEAHFSSPTPYADAVVRAGGIPVIIPPLKGSVQSLLARLDGIIFSGGSDIHPIIYDGAEDHPDLLPHDPLRDSVELELIKHAITLPELPILSICRGAQIGATHVHNTSGHHQATG